MSTKNLARTVIEGGRNRYSRYWRRHTNAVDRRRAHQLEHRLRHDTMPEDAHFPPREPAFRSFYDKLGPAFRWLRSQSGRPWDKVRSELFARFDIRTTAGRHIVFDHLLRELRPAPHDSHCSREFWISTHGILRHEPRSRKSFGAARRRPGLPEPEAVLCAWLRGRRVIEHGARLYWLVPTLHGAFRQDRELNEEEGRRIRGLPAWFRVTIAGPIALAGGSSK